MASQPIEQAIKKGRVKDQGNGLAFAWACIIKQAMRPCSVEIGGENAGFLAAVYEFSLQAMLDTLDHYDSATCKLSGRFKHSAVGSMSSPLNGLSLHLERSL